MEYLVTMTTHVPEGTAEDTVAAVRAREAAHSAELAAQGHLLRLWRPPLQPGEWRTLGLFAADDGGQLQDVLASMPLRVWRSDEVTPLLPHRERPGPGSHPARARRRGRGAGRGVPDHVHAGRPGGHARAAGRAEQRPGGAARARNWPGRGTCAGCGCCRARDARWACGRPGIRARCRPS